MGAVVNSETPHPHPHLVTSDSHRVDLNTGETESAQAESMWKTLRVRDGLGEALLDQF